MFGPNVEIRRPGAPARLRGSATASHRGAVAAALLAALSALPAPAQDAATQTASAVTVRYLDAAGTALRSSDGTLIREGLLVPLSALSGAAKVEVSARGEKTYTVTGLRSHKPDVDLALLGVDPAPMPSVYVPRLSNYLPGGTVKVWRGPAAGDTSIPGQTPFKFSLRGPDFIALTAEGASGGPVFKESGEFVGVAMSFNEPPYSTAWVVSVASILRLIEGASATPTPLDQVQIPPPWEYADKNSTKGLIFRGAILATVGKFEDARSFLTLAAKQDKSDPEAYYQTGQLLLKEKSYLEASARFQQAAEFAGNWHMAWHMSGVALNQAGRYKDAIEKYRKALEVDPNSSLTYSNIGGAHYNLGQYQEAVAAFQKSRELDPTNWVAYTNLANTYKRMNQMLPAEEIYQELLVKNPEVAAKLRKDLDAPR